VCNQVYRTMPTTNTMAQPVSNFLNRIFPPTNHSPAIVGGFQENNRRLPVEECSKQALGTS
jgi:hypothetical protein